MKHFLSVSKKLVAVCLAVLLAVVTVPALSVSAETVPEYDCEITLHGEGGTTNGGESTVVINYIDWKNAGYNDVFTREGYKFAGWQYYNGGNELTAIATNDENVALQTYLTSVVKSATHEDIHLYANWSNSNYYTINAEIGRITAADFANNKDYTFTSVTADQLFSGTKVNYDGIPCYISDLLDNNDEAKLAALDLVDQKLGWYYVNANGKLIKLENILDSSAFVNKTANLVYVVIHDTYSVAFDLKGGSFDANQQKVVKNVATYLTPSYSIPEPTKAGYNFTGWSVIDAATGKEISGSSKIEWSDDVYDAVLGYTSTLTLKVKAASGIKLVANWGSNKVVTYANTDYFTAEGLAKLAKETQFVTDITLRDMSSYMKDGYHFVGWATKAAGGSANMVDSDGSEEGQQINATQTVYAVVTFDVLLSIDDLENVYTNKTLSTAWTSVNASNNVNVVDGFELPTLYKKGYTFAGWALYKTGNSGEVVTVNGKPVIAHVYDAEEEISAPIVNALGVDCTLHAQWTKIEYTIKYNLNGADYIAYPSVTTKANEEKFYIDSTQNNASLYTPKFYAYTDDSVWYLKGTPTTISSLSELQAYIITNYATLKSTEFELVAVFPQILTEKVVNIVLHLDTIKGVASVAETDALKDVSDKAYTNTNTVVYATHHYYEVDYNYNVIKDLFVNVDYATDPEGYSDTEFKLANYIIDYNNLQAVQYLVNGVEVTYTDSLAHVNGYDYKEYDTSGAEFVGPEYGLEELTDTDALKAFNRISPSYSYKAMRKTTDAGSYTYFIAADGSDTNFTGAKVQTRSYSDTPSFNSAHVDTNVYVLKVKDANDIWRYFLRVDTQEYNVPVYPYAKLTKEWDDNRSYSLTKTADLSVSETTKIVLDLASKYKFTGWVDVEGNVVSSLGAADLSKALYGDHDGDPATDDCYYVDLYATWAESSTANPKTLYKVIYSIDEDTVISSETSYEYFVAGQTELALATPTKVGYTFNGWCLAADGTGVLKTYLYGNATEANNVFASNSAVKSVTLYPNWTAVNKAIVFHVDGGTIANAATLGIEAHNTSDYKYVSFNIENDYDLTKVAPAKTGYTFVGWYEHDSANLTADDEPIESLAWIDYINKGTADVYAIYKVNTYSISYDLEGGKGAVNNPTEFTTIASATVAPPTKDGYTFYGWRVVSENNLIKAGNSNLSVAYSEFNKDVELEAIWVANKYTLYFDDVIYQFNNNAYNYANGNDEATCEYGKTYKFYDLVLIDGADAKNYEFIGWYNIQQSSAYLDYINDGYSVEEIRGLTGKDIKKVSSTADLTVVPTTASYTIFAWYRTVTDYVKVSFNYNGGVIDTKTYIANKQIPEVVITNKVEKSEAEAINAPIVIKEGYNLTGWYKDTVNKTKETMSSQTLAEDTVYYAIWTIKTPSTISYDCAGGQLVKVGYTTVGGKLVDENKNIVFADVYAGKAVAIYGVATKVGYTFKGWSYNGQIVSEVPAGITGVDSIKLVAVWEANKYTVEFNNYNATTEAYEKFEQELTYDQIAKLADVASMGFTAPKGKEVFTGWALTAAGAGKVANKQAVKNLSTGETVKYYATWDKAAFIITYENLVCEEENVVAVNNNEVSLVDGYTTYNLQNPTMEGHIFEGWYTDPSLNSGSRVYQLQQVNKQGTITLYAKWSPDTYRINFNLGSSDAQWSQLTVLADGTAYTIPDFPQEHKHEAIDLTKLAIPTLKGYVFAGWVDENGNKVEEISAINTKTVNLTATWDLYTYTQLFVGRVYKTFLRDTINRVPTDAEIKAVLAADKEGTDYWADELGRGIQTGASFVYNLYLSKEYQARLAKLSTKKAQYSQFIADLYMSMMGRTWNNVENYDEVGYTYWLNQMINGQKAEDVIKNFARSVEFQGICEEYGIKNIIEK